MEQVNGTQTNLACDTLFAGYPDVVGAEEIAKMLCVSRKQVYKILREGKITAIRCGRSYKAAKVNVIKYVLQGAQ